MQDVELKQPSGQTVGVAQCASADIDSIVDRMYEIYTHYDAALEKGRAASKRMHDRFTWDVAGERFVEILEKHAGGKVVS